MADKKKPVVTNRQAHRDYYIENTYEAGLALKGSEVKSLRGGKANLKGSFACVEKGEIFIHGMHISPYKYSQDEYNPIRKRKLLLHKREIEQIIVKSLQKGQTIVPLKIYFSRGHAKIEIALARGKKHYDKRTAIKKKEATREVDRALRHKNR